MDGNDPTLVIRDGRENGASGDANEAVHSDDHDSDELDEHDHVFGCTHGLHHSEGERDLWGAHDGKQRCPQRHCGMMLGESHPIRLTVRGWPLPVHHSPNHGLMRTVLMRCCSLVMVSRSPPSESDHWENVPHGTNLGFVELSLDVLVP